MRCVLQNLAQSFLPIGNKKWPRRYNFRTRSFDYSSVAQFQSKTPENAPKNVKIGLKIRRLLDRYTWRTRQDLNPLRQNRNLILYPIKLRVQNFNYHSIFFYCFCRDIYKLIYNLFNYLHLLKQSFRLTLRFFFFFF